MSKVLSNTKSLMEFVEYSLSTTQECVFFEESVVFNNKNEIKNILKYIRSVNVKFCLVSKNSRLNIITKLKECELYSYFLENNIICQEDLKTRQIETFFSKNRLWFNKKRHLNSIFIKASLIMNLHPRQCVAVTSETSSLISSASAKITTVLFNGKSKKIPFNEIDKIPNNCKYYEYNYVA